VSVTVPLDELPQALERFGLNSPETNEVVFVQPGKAVLHVSKA